MTPFRIDSSSGVATYLQLVHQVRQAIRLGVLVPNGAAYIDRGTEGLSSMRLAAQAKCDPARNAYGLTGRQWTHC